MKFVICQKGQIMVLGLVVISLVLVNTLLIVAGAILFAQTSKASLEMVQAVNLAEAGVDKALASLNASGGVYSGEVDTLLGSGSYTVTVVTSGNNKIIESTGFVPSSSAPRSKRTIKISASKGIGASFKYGVQVGEGGLTMGSNDTITGSVYSNGNITAVNRGTVTGDVWIAGGTQGSPNQSADCSLPNCSDFEFGKVIQSESRFDVAQGFKQSVSGVLNKVSIKIKKIASPTLDVTVRVLADNNGKPDKTQVKGSGTLYRTLVTSEYNWVEVTFLEPPNLTAETQYWLVLDSSSNGSNYWSWQLDPLQGYPTGRGVSKWSPDWKAGNPQWNSMNGSLSFQTFSGGVITYFDGGSNMVVQGNVHANTIKNAAIGQGAYYQALESNSVTAGSFHPGSSDPSPKTFPISEGNITQWKQEAESFGTTNGNVTACQSNIGPGKISGNVSLSGCTTTVHSPLWVVGDFILDNSNTLTLDSSFGGTSGVIIVDGLSELKNNNIIRGTSTGSSSLMLLSTYDSRSSGIPAIRLSNTGNSSFLYAANGIIQPGNSNIFQELTAWKIDIFNSSTVSYETGLASTFFSSGPSGSYFLVKGTYQVK